MYNTVLDYFQINSEFLMNRLLMTFVIILFSYVAQKLTIYIFHRALTRVHIGARLITLKGILENTVSIAVWIVMLLAIASEWGINILPIITGAGVIGLAVGFGTQTLVRDVVTGFFILLENQYNTGDVVQIAGVKGRVLQINLRTTILQGEDGSVHIVPNSQINQVAKGMSFEPTEKEPEDK